jgi:hypothetical protein
LIPSEYTLGICRLSDFHVAPRPVRHEPTKDAKKKPDVGCAHEKSNK